MLHANRIRHAELILLFDLCLLGLTVALARALTRAILNEPGGTIHYAVEAWKDCIFAALLCTAWVISSVKVHLYDNKRTEGVPSEAGSGLLCLFISMASAVLLFELAFEVPYRRYFYCASTVTGLALLVLGRFAFGSLLRTQRRLGRGRRRILIVGRNPGVYALLDTLADNHHFGVEVVGVVDAPPECNLRHPVSGRALPAGVRELGTTDDLERIFTREVVDEVLVLLPMRSFYVQIEQILKVCEEVGVVTKLLPDLFNVNIARRTIAWVGDMPFLTYFTGPKENLELGLKRCMDVLVSGSMLLLLSPVLVGISLWILITSPGPILFKQRRSGLNGRPFDMLKFRSMYIDAEERRKELEAQNEQSGPVFKMKNDPRITPVGRILRKFSLDELPQLINILKGEMSLVGPRPPIPAEVEQYDWWQRRRLSFRPGLTCIWQVSGRNAIGFDEWMEMDLAYIDNWSLALDLSLMVRTIPVVLTGKGAS